MQLLPRDFFARPSVEVAPDLLGCVLEHETADGLVAVELTEVEAYAGASDPASHAYRGKTRRNAVMFGPPGHAYVYFTYGMYFCVNLVCLGEAASASAVLLRAGAIVAGEELARARRTRGRAPSGTSSSGASPGATGMIASRDLARGPARLCLALGIDRALDGADACVPSSPLRVGTGAEPAPRSVKIASGPRVGVSSAAEIPWRFWLEGDPTVSVYRAAVPRRRKLVTP
ncbi:MAG TPA: DNA-3-methyladenine glycosylase [Streptosporangiaceae bacterium]|nr:DNA-3-methyladenine glycosylase [Streptosporangiaceae bacterium]